jgi:hypothetical protein
MAHFRPNQRNGVRAAAVFLTAALSFMAQTPPPSAVETDGAAKLLTFVGQISVIRSNYSWALDVGKTVNRQETVVTGPDGWGVFQVADGSKFEVFPNSRVVFRANMGDWRDLLEVWLGKVRVQIEHFGGLPNNNKVRTPSAVISVRGTIFDVEVIADSEDTIVSDEEGSVGVEHALKPGPTTILNHGESVRVFKNAALAKAVIDKAGLFQRAVHAASDAFYQAALNARNSGAVGHVGTAGSASGTAADKNNGTAAAPPPPPGPPPPPPH